MLGFEGLEKYGKKKWRHYVADVIKRLVAATKLTREGSAGAKEKR